jgi:hypothetical protein
MPIPGPGDDDLIAAFDASQPSGDVLGLVCGPGVWTERLLHYATNVTAVVTRPVVASGLSARGKRVMQSAFVSNGDRSSSSLIPAAHRGGASSGGKTGWSTSASSAVG